jgi:hypothetical protein
MQRTLLPLWDYGWVDYGPVSLAGVSVATDAPTAYVCSPEFGTSFVGPQRDDSADIHGPFRRETLSASDFVHITPLEFRSRISEIRQPAGFAEPVCYEQWRPVEALVSDLCSRCVAIYMLRFTEVDRDRLHEWGSVLDVFREFICVERDLTVTRIVFGYD